MRKTIASQVPIVKTDKDIAILLKLSQSALIDSIFNMFEAFSNLNTFRAVEPALKLKYQETNCFATRNNYTVYSCLKERNLRLGSRGQLTKLVLDYKESILINSNL